MKMIGILPVVEAAVFPRTGQERAEGHIVPTVTIPWMKGSIFTRSISFISGIIATKIPIKNAILTKSIIRNTILTRNIKTIEGIVLKITHTRYLAYPVQMGELVEQIIDGVLSRLQGVPASYSDFQNTQQFPPSEPSPRVETVSSVSASDVESAHSEAATLQSQLSESTRETSIINEHASDARLTIEGRIPLMESNLPNGFETPKSQPQLHVDITAMTVVAVCHDEDEFYTPTESGEPAMNSYFECSIKDTDTYQETNLLQLSS
jgi:hypothetical protein